MSILPKLIIITVGLVRVISTVISEITETPRINTRSPRTTMLASLAAANDWWQSTVHKTDVVDCNISKHIITSLSLKNNLEWCGVTPDIKFSLKPVFACKKDLIN